MLYRRSCYLRSSVTKRTSQSQNSHYTIVTTCFLYVQSHPIASKIRCRLTRSILVRADGSGLSLRPTGKKGAVNLQPTYFPKALVIRLVISSPAITSHHQSPVTIYTSHQPSAVRCSSFFPKRMFHENNESKFKFKLTSLHPYIAQILVKTEIGGELTVDLAYLFD